MTTTHHSKPSHDPPPPPAKVFGWKAIAAALEVSVRSAKAFASREYDPLPVEHGHRGPWAYESALRDWIRRQNKPHKVHIELLRLRKELNAKRTAPARAAAARRRQNGSGRLSTHGDA